MTEKDLPKTDYRKRVQDAVDRGVPRFYVNGFANTMSAGDITTVLEWNGQPVAILNMSYTMAKTLSAKLGVLIARLEAATGRDMLTTDEIALALSTKDKKSGKKDA